MARHEAERETRASAGPAFDPRSLAGSRVRIEQCYQENASQYFCFVVSNGSTDAEWIDRILLVFPTLDGPWNASCDPSSHDPVDSAGYPVSFTCSSPQVNEVLYQDGDGDGYGEISAGGSWRACVQVNVPAGYEGPRFVPWTVEGDDGGSETGSVELEKCTPLTLYPSSFDLEGCNGTAQSLDFELTNYGAGNVTVDLSYVAPQAELSGPGQLYVAQGTTVTWTSTFTPDLCVAAGDTVTGTVIAAGGGYGDESSVSQLVSADGGWQRLHDSPVATMDNVVVWASHRDGGLWSIGGHGAGGATQRFDPGSGVWTTHQSEAVLGSVIEYPMDGCYGLDGSDPETAHEIVVLFPDTTTTTVSALHVYDITDDSWSTRPYPQMFPVGYNGRWGFDVVSLRNNPSLQPGIGNPNLCYLSGGADQNGGGRTKDLWVYDPATNGGQYLGAFPASIWFGFHASWYVPWVGVDGAICVAGGIDHNSQINDSTQCYDLATGSFHALNADLGALPEPWWGMADGWRISEDGYEIWLANGVDQSGLLLPISAYLREGMQGFSYGPELPDALYRLEGDGFEGRFFTLNGARGGFSSSEFSLHMAPCPLCSIVFQDDFETGDASEWSSQVPAP